MTIENFEKQPFYKEFEQWIINMLANDYYQGTLFDDDGNIKCEGYLDEKGVEEAWSRAFSYAQLLYEANNPIPYCQNIVKKESLQKQIQNAPKPDGMALVAAWGTCFCLMLVDIQNIHNFKRFVLLRSIESCVSAAFREMEMEHEWLEFYVLMYRFIYRYTLPEELATDVAMKYWGRLQQAGLINNQYQTTWSNGMKNWHVYEIMTYLSSKIGCTRTILENHFKRKNGEPNTNWRKEGRAHHEEDEIMRKIKSCFRG